MRRLSLCFLMLGISLTVQAAPSSDSSIMETEAITVDNASRLQEIAVIAPDGSDLYSTIPAEAGPAHAQTSLAFGLDGRYLVAGSVDAAVRVWDMKTGQQQFTLLGHEDRVNAVAFAPSNTGLEDILASAGGSYDGQQDYNVRLWDTRSGELTHVLQGHTAPVTSIVFHSAEPLILTADLDGRILQWDLAAIIKSSQVFWDEFLEYYVGETPITDLAFNSTSQLLAITGGTQVLVGARVRSGWKLYGALEHGAPVYDAVFDPDVHFTLSIAAVGENGAMIWATYEGAWEWSGQLLEHWLDEARYSANITTFPNKIAVNSTRELLVLAMGNEVQLWSYEATTRLIILTGHESGITDIAFSPGDRLLLSTGVDGTIRLWGLPSADE